MSTFTPDPKKLDDMVGRLVALELMTKERDDSDGKTINALASALTAVLAVRLPLDHHPYNAGMHDGLAFAQHQACQQLENATAKGVAL